MFEGGVQAGDGGDQSDRSAHRAHQDQVPTVEFDWSGDRPANTPQTVYSLVPTTTTLTYQANNFYSIFMG